MDKKLETAINELLDTKVGRINLGNEIKKLEEDRKNKHCSIEEEIKKLTETRTEFYNKFSDFFKKD
jgi:hypothetical protein